ncbi:nuclear transport factor 2 family protein [Brevundimonas sp.]|uniref:nuclear transport factor 2 family protein n=1 Tax=Brevundimonas sp. TaxID=1871086 RepID=UPI002ABC4C4F|nr:nuclear transport factor 2 family protein [Brevundimonas sp.]MDZ4364513.1 nuclear transport factor 2 family protein [Brevundimonas sp.]
MFDCDPVEVVDRQLAAYQANDLNGFVQMYAPGAVVSEFPGSPVMTGHDEMRAGYASSFGDRTFTLTLGERIVNGQFVIDEEIIGVDDREVMRAVVMYQVEGCLIARSWILPIAEAVP